MKPSGDNKFFIKVIQKPAPMTVDMPSPKCHNVISKR